ncbi:MotA/TolQ/ExbB proton channel family protein [Chrysiogenes arsenatis]|uniref:MotA/TolQ/ExbB proton channel family protein n=1 Tax=Chrysiogenes arsenatis TaxID=309797 RepID=UPI000425E7FC|nr:MotA/TolQ/ExbB proton channel family protein [Chrysiogenes arsenatis]
MADALFAISSYIDAGGNVLWAILIVAVALWTLILERYWYHWRVFPQEFAALRAQWENTTLTDIWLARKIQQMDVARLRHQLGGSVFLIRTLIAMCPLLGLLGTVVGMIQVFEVLEFSGTGNPRAIASGVSMATIPTMSGLVVALSGLFFSIDLARASEHKARKAADVLSQTLAKIPGLHCHVTGR